MALEFKDHRLALTRIACSHHKAGTKWLLTTTNLSDEFWQRAQRLTELRRSERDQMQEYVSLSSGHMDFLIRALDGESRKGP